MQTHKLIVKYPAESEGKHPEKFTEMTLIGVDNSGVKPQFLGFMIERGSSPRKITHVIAKMPGYSWYYNQYQGQQYSGVSVHIYPVDSYEIDTDKHEYTFNVESPFMEEFQKARVKK